MTKKIDINDMQEIRSMQFKQENALGISRTEYHSGGEYHKEWTVRENGSLDVSTVNTEPSMTQQQFADESDINNIIRKYHQTGEITHLNRKAGVYADVSKITDYQESMNKILNAQDAFDTLPSDLRNRFQNDPAQMIAFLANDQNYNEAVELGLVEPKPEPVIKTKNQPQKSNEQNKTNDQNSGDKI